MHSRGLFNPDHPVPEPEESIGCSKLLTDMTHQTNAAKDREQLEALSNALPVEGRPSFCQFCLLTNFFINSIIFCFHEITEPNLKQKTWFDSFRYCLTNF